MARQVGSQGPWFVEEFCYHLAIKHGFHDSFPSSEHLQVIFWYFYWVFFHMFDQQRVSSRHKRCHLSVHLRRFHQPFQPREAHQEVRMTLGRFRDAPKDRLSRIFFGVFPYFYHHYLGFVFGDLATFLPYHCLG